MKEICICAAIYTTDGKLVRGHRHRDCRDNAARRGLYPHPTWESEGFMTSRNRFVNRKEGYRLQIEAGIKSANPEGYQICGWLFSEDLY